MLDSHITAQSPSRIDARVHPLELGHSDLNHMIGTAGPAIRDAVKDLVDGTARVSQPVNGLALSVIKAVRKVSRIPR